MDKNLQSFSEFEARLDKAQNVVDARRESDLGGGTKALGRAWMVALELVTAIVVSSPIGWFFDSLFKTRPLLLIVFFFLGVGAGLLNVYRGAQKLEREAAKIGDSKEMGS